MIFSEVGRRAVAFLIYRKLPKKKGEYGTLPRAVALFARLALVFEAFFKHFHLFFDLSLTGGAAFTFVIATFFAR
jgi:hypothetical protein